MSTGQPTLPVVDAKGKGRALPPNFELDSGIPNQDYHGIATNHAESSSMAQWWRHSRETAQADHKSWDYGEYDFDNAARHLRIADIVISPKQWRRWRCCWLCRESQRVTTALYSR